MNNFCLAEPCSSAKQKTWRSLARADLISIDSTVKTRRQSWEGKECPRRGSKTGGNRRHSSSRVTTTGEKVARREADSEGDIELNTSVIAEASRYSTCVGLKVIAKHRLRLGIGKAKTDGFDSKCWKNILCLQRGTSKHTNYLK